jgi:dihydrofolate synthase/folylpolyglutamate synthase
MFSKVGASAIKEGLGNTETLCRFLGNPERKFKSIHIGGTNGKGSTSHLIAAVLQEAGYKTGLYTSPHLKDFRERIRINGTMVPKEFVIDFTERIIPSIDELNPSFFEITVAMAFDYFAQEKVDVAVIEVGLGGRLDSTNVISPDLSVITNIGWDHMNVLGNTLEKIASEKAGIIKKNVPVVIGQTQTETEKVFIEKASVMDAPISFADKKRFVADYRHHNHLLEVMVDDHHTDRKKYQLDLTGVYQLKNIITVLESIHQLQIKGYRITEDHIQKGLSASKKINGLHGRWELLQQAPKIIADVAHNVDGIRQLMMQLEMTDYHDLHIVLGMVKDKDVDAVLPLFPKEATYYFTNANIPRALDATALQQKSMVHELQGNVYPDVHRALDAAKLHANKDDLILVCGSVFLVGEII